MPHMMPGENSKFMMRAERARTARIEQERLRHDIVARRIKEREFDTEIQRWKHDMEWNLYLVALWILMTLEHQRDGNEPKTPDEPWNEKFCEAIRWIPEARMFLEEMSITCIRSEIG